MEVAPPVKLPSLEPVPGFWDKLAYCETHGDWKNRGNWAGGLGIARSTWGGFGGHEFAKSPDRATKSQQIAVATRVAITGYLRPDGSVKPAVGFNGWGALKCAGGKPQLIAHSVESVVRQQFMWGQKGRLVKDLQAIIKVKADGIYGAKTYAAHLRYIATHGQNYGLLPKPKIKKLKLLIPDHKKCEQYRNIVSKSGFPQFDIENVLYVMWKESRCIPTVRNGKDPHGGSYGLMQINAVWEHRLISSNVIKTLDELYEPQKNVLAALFIWSYSIDAKNYGWHPWGLY
jgi:hypothetical protein